MHGDIYLNEKPIQANIIITNIPIPKIKSKTYSLSKISSTYGLTFGKIYIVKT